jgi:hypothetical protein
VKKDAFCYILVLIVFTITSCSSGSSSPDAEYGAQNRAYVQGKIINTSGQPVINEEIEILAVQNNLLLGTSITDTNGEFDAIVLETGLRSFDAFPGDSRSGDNGFLVRLKDTSYQHTFVFAYADYQYNQDHIFPEVTITQGVPVTVNFTDQNSINLLENVNLFYTNSECLEYYRDYENRTRSNECHQEFGQMKEDGINSMTTNNDVLLDTQIRVSYTVDGLEQEQLFLINQEDAIFTINY